MLFFSILNDDDDDSISKLACFSGEHEEIEIEIEIEKSKKRENKNFVERKEENGEISNIYIREERQREISDSVIIILHTILLLLISIKPT